MTECQHQVSLLQGLFLLADLLQAPLHISVSHGSLTSSYDRPTRRGIVNALPAQPNRKGVLNAGCTTHINLRDLYAVWLVLGLHLHRDTSVSLLQPQTQESAMSSL